MRAPPLAPTSKVAHRCDTRDRSASQALAGFPPTKHLTQSPPWPGTDGSLLAKARWLYVLRRRRGRFVDAELLGEPGWDMLLDLFIHAEEGRLVSVSSVTVAADVPQTTALRWLRTMERRGVVVRTHDDADRRRAFVTLSEDAATELRLYLASLS